MSKCQPTRMASVIVGVIAFAGFGVKVLEADVLPAGMTSCAQILADRERLACYDRVIKRQAAPTDRATAAAAVESPPRRAMIAPVAPAGENGSKDGRGGATVSMLERAWSFAPDTDRYLIKLYRPNYVAPVRYASRVNDQPFSPVFTAVEGEDQDLDNLEAAFQISFKARLWASDDRRLGAWFAYTQLSFWQVYNGEISSPFRDTNYMPELKLSWQPNVSFGGFDWGLLSIGYLHESNGRADPISRSWDRLVAEVGIERGDFALLLRPWIRIDDEDGDKDNPDITDYLGYGDITAVYKWRGHSFTLMGRGNPSTEKGAVRLTWMTPPILGPLRGYVVGFAGYGDSLIDYNFKQNAISAGVALNDLLDR